MCASVGCNCFRKQLIGAGYLARPVLLPDSQLSLFLCKFIQLTVRSSRPSRLELLTFKNFELYQSMSCSSKTNQIVMAQTTPSKDELHMLNVASSARAGCRGVCTRSDCVDTAHLSMKQSLSSVHEIAVWDNTVQQVQVLASMQSMIGQSSCRLLMSVCICWL